MADTEKEQVWVNTLIERRLVKILDQMVDEASSGGAKSDRAKFMRWLVEQEAIRRGLLPTPPPQKRNTDRRAALAATN